ncbi:hypothetical protein ACQ4M3_39040 [Leptolyngbya sp. AN03gr2]|uniref:hypothetical protein n=1 Tax=unclassified Leptolyngbya TaxID=2650499 RepID=UPI003D31C113
MSRFSLLSLRSALGLCSLIAIVGFNPHTFATESSPTQRSEPTQQNVDATSPAAACWRLTYTLNNVGHQSQLNLNRDRGTLSTTLTPSTGQPDLRQQTIRISDVDTDGWIRRQLFFWLNRLQQRQATEQELAQLNQQIDRGNLTGTSLETAKQRARSLQALLTSSDPQTVVLSQMKTEAVQRFKQSQQQIEAQTKQAEQTLAREIEQRQQQIMTMLQDPKQRKQLDDQLQQINAAIRSGQLRGEQLQQAQRAQRELQQIRNNPNSIRQRAQEFRVQQLESIRSSRQSALEQAQGELSKQMLMIENGDNVLVVVTDSNSSSNPVQPQAFSLQLRNNQYIAQTCDAKGKCAPIAVTPCS